MQSAIKEAVVSRPNLRHAKCMLFFAVFFACSACSGIFTDEDKLDEGRCNFHTDCKDGERCRNTYCEDVYYPRREIKPF